MSLKLQSVFSLFDGQEVCAHVKALGLSQIPAGQEILVTDQPVTAS